METTTETRTDASIVYELLLKSRWTTGWMDASYELKPTDWHYECPTSDVLALHQDWTRRYSTGQDA